MPFEYVLYEQEGALATITLNRPERLNPISVAMTEEITQCLDQAASDPEVRVAVITGAGRGFCSGADLSDIGGRSDGVARRVITRVPSAGGIKMFTPALLNFEKPLIAAVNGPAAGAGVGLAMACDIRIASEKAVFAMTYTARGLSPDAGISYLLPRAIGLSKACEMAFTADRLSAQEAKDWGLVSRVVPHEELMSAAKALAARIARNAPLAVNYAKRLMHHGASSDLPAAMELEGFLIGLCLGTADFKEGARAFLEKREPRFEGR